MFTFEEKLQLAALPLFIGAGLGYVLELRWLFYACAGIIVGTAAVFMLYCGVMAYRELWQMITGRR